MMMEEDEDRGSEDDEDEGSDVEEEGTPPPWQVKRGRRGA